MLLTEPTYLFSISHQMILLVLAKTERIRDHSSINTQRTTILFIRLLPPTTLLPRGETLLATALTYIFRKSLHVSSTSKPANHQHPKIFKYFFACRIVLAANHQYPGNLQRLSQQQQPAAASSINQQQQPAATSSSNQQQRSAAATSNSNQQQRPAAATTSSNQHSSYQQSLHNQRRPPLVITTVLSSGYPASSSLRISCPVAECNHRTKWLHFCYFSTFLKSLFCNFSLFC